jgi:RNA-binding protein YhbY
VRIINEGLRSVIIEHIHREEEEEEKIKTNNCAAEREERKKVASPRVAKVTPGLKYTLQNVTML